MMHKRSPPVRSPDASLPMVPAWPRHVCAARACAFTRFGRSNHGHPSEDIGHEASTLVWMDCRVGGRSWVLVARRGAIRDVLGRLRCGAGEILRRGDVDARCLEPESAGDRSPHGPGLDHLARYRFQSVYRRLQSPDGNGHDQFHNQRAGWFLRVEGHLHTERDGLDREDRQSERGGELGGRRTTGRYWDIRNQSNAVRDG